MPWWVLAALFTLTGVPEGGDILLLKDGRILDGLKMEYADDGVKVAFENGEVVVPEDLILEAVLQDPPPYEAKDEKEQEALDKGRVRFDGRWVTVSQRDKLLAKRIKQRRAEIEELKKNSLWRNRSKEDTRHFVFEHTLPPHIFEYYRDLMEAYFTDFAKKWKVRNPKEGKLKVCFYVDRESYHQISAASRGVVGYFRFVPPMELDIFYDRQTPEFTEDVMFHEANHYLQKLVNLKFKVPHFPGESLAEYYGASHWDPDKKKLTVGMIQEGRLTEIQEDIAKDKRIGLQQLITTDGMYEHYTWGWSLVHYLMNQKGLDKKFHRFFMDLANGSNVKREFATAYQLWMVDSAEVWRVFKKSLGLKTEEDVKELEAAWHGYIEQGLGQVTARGLEKAALAAANRYPRREIRAKRLFQEAIALDTKSPLTYHSYAKLLADDDDHKEAVAMWDKAIELDPLNAAFYAYKGKSLKEMGKEEEGKRLLKLAREIDPDDPSLAFTFRDLFEG